MVLVAGRQRTPSWSFWRLVRNHACLLRHLVCLARIAGDAGADDIVPSVGASYVSGNDMIDVEVPRVLAFSAVLAGKIIAPEDVLAGKLDLSLRQPIEVREDNDTRNGILS